MTTQSLFSTADNPDALWRRVFDAGMAAIGDGDPETAISALSEAASLKPRDGLTTFNLGVAFLRGRQFPEALRTFELFRDIDPENASAHHGVGLALAAQSDRAAAVASFQKATSLDETAWQAWLSVAETTSDPDLRRRSLEGAMKALETAWSSAPNDDALFLDFVKALIRHNHHARAIPLIRRNYDRFENEAAIHDMLGRAYYRSGRFQRAFAEKQQTLLKFDPAKTGANAQSIIFNPSDAVAVLHEVKAVFDAAGIEFFLAAGTLLGFFRNGGPLPHDRDVDVGVLATSHTSAEVADAILRHDNFALGIDCNPGDRYLGFECKGVAVDVFLHDKDADFLQCGVTNIPRDINWRFQAFDVMHTDYSGDRWPVPSIPERYLEESYGRNWLTPDKGFASAISSPALYDVDDYARGYYSVNRARHCLLRGDTTKARALIDQSPVPAFLPIFLNAFDDQ